MKIIKILILYLWLVISFIFNKRKSKKWELIGFGLLVNAISAFFANHEWTLLVISIAMIILIKEEKND